MENVLTLYEEEFDARHPVVCFDETSKQLVRELRPAVPAKSGEIERFDYEYKRNGVANLFMMCEPKAGWRHVEVTDRHTKLDFAEQMKYLVDEAFPEAEKIRVVMDNLSTHSRGALYDRFTPDEAARVLQKLEFHFTPKHASWLNMAEIELSVLARQCLSRRIADKEKLTTEVKAWEEKRNQAKSRIEWKMTVEDAREKLIRHYPRVLKYLCKRQQSTFIFNEEKIMPITPEVLDQILKDYEKPEDLLSDNGLLQQLTKALLERALNGELTHHLGYEKHDPAGNNSGNSRNGTTPKVVKGKRGQVEIEVPRDRNGEFEPQLVKKNQKRFDGLDEKIISLYSRGLTQNEIKGHLEEIYGVDISSSLISTVTDAVLDEVRAWQSRPLDAVYPILYLDALQVKVKSQGSVRNKAIYLAFGVTMTGLKEVLGMWAADTEGSKFWMQIITELKNRGVQDIFIACVDGLKGFPEAIEAIYPQTQIQLCIVHLVRHSLFYVSHKDRKEVAMDLKCVYQAPTLDEADYQLSKFAEKWTTAYPMVVRSWQQNWARIIPMFSFAPEIRKAIYTTNTIESLNMTLRKVIKNRPLFPSDEAVFKIMYLALRNISKKWTMPIQNWSGAMNQFAILFENRLPSGSLTNNSFTQNF